MSAEPVVAITGVRKQYQGLRPLRVNGLSVAAGERVALSGFDAGAAEVLVNLLTGASVPDVGEVRILGRLTASITDADEWLATLDHFGIVSPRAVLLDAASVAQNIAMPFSLEIEPVPPAIAAKVAALADDIGIDRADLDRPIAGLAPPLAARTHLARAAALSPSLLILEHPTASLPEDDRQAFGEAVARLAAIRRLTAVIITEDPVFAEAAATRRLALNPATGDLKPPRRRFFGL